MIIINEAKRRWMRDGGGDSNFIKRLIVTCYEKMDHLEFFIMIEF